MYSITSSWNISIQVQSVRYQTQPRLNPRPLMPHRDTSVAIKILPLIYSVQPGLNPRPLMPHRDTSVASYQNPATNTVFNQEWIPGSKCHTATLTQAYLSNKLYIKIPKLMIGMIQCSKCHTGTQSTRLQSRELSTPLHRERSR